MSTNLPEQPDQKAEAMRRLDETILREPKNEIAWLRLSELVVDENEVVDCLQHVIAINPNNYAAKQRLVNMKPVTKESRSKPEESHVRNPKSSKRKVSTAPVRSDITPRPQGAGSEILNFFAGAFLEFLISLIIGSLTNSS